MQTNVDAPLGRDVAASVYATDPARSGALLATVNESDPWEGRWHERLRWGRRRAGAGVVRGAGRYAVGNANGELFAVTRRCRHLGADLADGSVDREGCLVCPWHGARYDVATGRMTRGPQGFSRRSPARMLATVC